MKKTIFTNETFYYLLLIYLGSLLCYNLYYTIKAENILGILPVAIQSTLLFLILTKNKHARQAILIWSVIFIIIAPSMIITGNLLSGLGSDFKEMDQNRVINNLFVLGSGVFVLVCTKKTVIVTIPKPDIDDAESLKSPDFN